MKRYYNTGGASDVYTQDIPTVDVYDNIGGNYVDQTYGGDIDAGMADVFGLNDPYVDEVYGGDIDAGLAEAYGLNGSDDGTDWLDAALGFVGNNWQDLLNTGISGAAMYGAYQGNQDRNALSQAQIDLNRELGTAKLELERDRSGISDLDSMAAKAMGMGILANRGRLSADQSNPWLNFMFQGRQGLWGDDDQFGKAYEANPFGASPLGAAVVRAPEEFLQLGGGMGQPRINRMSGFAEGGAVPRMGMRARLNQMRAERNATPQNVMGGLRAGLQGMQAPRQLQNMISPEMIAQIAAKQRQMGGADLQNMGAGMYDAGIAGSQMPQIPPGMAQAQVMPDIDYSNLPTDPRFQELIGRMQGTAGQVGQQMPQQWGQMPAQLGAMAGGMSAPQSGTQAGGMRARLNQMRQDRGMAPQNMMGTGMAGAGGMFGRMGAGLQGALSAFNNRKNVSDPSFRAYASGGALGYLGGGSGGQEDDVNANLSHGEYVIDADSVSALGDGNNEAGARELDEMIEAIRSHKRSAPASKIPPKSKGALAYLGRK